MCEEESKIYTSEKLKSALNRFSNAINKINVFAYRQVYLLSNGVLSRNPYINKLLGRFYEDSFTSSVDQSYILLLAKLLSYYMKSFAKFFVWLLQKFFFSLSGYKSSNLNKHTEGLVLIDTYFVVPNLKRNDYRDRAYLRNLDLILEKHGKEYSYLPIFYGEKNPFKYISIFNAFKKNNVDYITEYELLNLADICKITWFILTYPFVVLRLAKNLETSDKDVALVKDELLLTIDQITWGSYARYLVGRRVGEKVKDSKLISWCEYQSIQKNLYKGLRDKNKSIKIFGCQFFLRFGDWVNIDIPNSEVDSGIAPDLILVNGRAAMVNDSKVPHKLGASLRNKPMFGIANNNNNKSELFPILLLSYLEGESKRLLQLIGDSGYKNKKVYVKAHPTLNLASLKPYISNHWIIVEGDLYDRLEDANIVIVTASGTAAEAVVIGKSVIVIGDPNGITTNPLLNLGKGKIWDIAETSEEVTNVAKKLLEYRVSNEEIVSQLSEKYKSLLFIDATDEDILAMFDL
ncbi:hypothetical protein [Colwellia hornerae]|uniref:Uncharacterized protein n=1 Tax=Colwellia hornerae TaxID=89402 RepID=A0A5C6QJT5_9GAMM|nr:hypothetical protein [Colwellia hornerae]TWX54054.1 hypothetical protein ESZ28_08350 [Colwellia hornerae]TWX60829.1 hypothetical protein ESZ26_07125 [Colwellia hornerae]TWX69159.1 hypothetical protein ESZ27_05885 [Colwellia hornerae]